MTSSVDSLTGMPMPALGAANVAVRPNAAASAAASATEGGGFHKLMHLQQRGRTLEAKLQQQASGASAQDPAATAQAQQQAFYAKEFQSIRELVGPTPGGNARRALAAILERLEGGGELKGSDRARIKLAIAADQKQVDLAGALRMRAAILSVDDATSKLSTQTEDPTLLQDPARLAQFRQQMQHRGEELKRLEQLIAAGTFDQASIDGAFTPTT